MRKQTLAIYGAGAVAITVFKSVCDQYDVVCFIDKDKAKQGLLFCDLPILSLENAVNTYPELHIYVALSDTHKFQAMNDLITSGISADKIVNYEPYKKYKSCAYLESRMSINSRDMWFCCCGYQMKTTPVVKYADTPEESIDKFIETRDYVIGIISQENVKSEDYPDIDCIGCPQIRENFWGVNKKIKDLSVTLYHKCNFDCVYCVINNEVKEVGEVVSLEHILDCIREAEKRNLIAPDARIAPVPTEISVYPKRDLVFDVFSKYNSAFCSNASVFLPRLAEAISQKGKLTVSVDAGTRETFKRIKKVDFFERVSENIIRYAEYGNVTLKYIFLKGYNINYKDADGFFELCTKCSKCNVQIARDYEDDRVNTGKTAAMVRTSESAINKPPKVLLDENELSVVSYLYNKLISHKIPVIIISELFSESELRTLYRLIGESNENPA